MSKVELRMEGGNISINMLSDANKEQRLSMGAVSNIRGMFERGSLTASKVEAAIAEIEDMIMPTLRAVHAAPELMVSGAELRQVMLALTSMTEPVPISVVEAAFNQLADIASGSPARLHRLSTEPNFVLGLILLREVMHHGGFSYVSVHD